MSKILSLLATNDTLYFVDNKIIYLFYIKMYVFVVFFMKEEKKLQMLFCTRSSPIYIH